MIELEELAQRLQQSSAPIENLKEALDIDNLKTEVEKLEAQSAAPDFWNDAENSQKIMQKIGSMKAKIASYETLKNDFDDAFFLLSAVLCLELFLQLFCPLHLQKFFTFMERSWQILKACFIQVFRI